MVPMADIYRVLIEFKRIQTYLFAVPRLRTMLGANALVGEAMRVTLPSLLEGRTADWLKIQLGIDVPNPSWEQGIKDPLGENSPGQPWNTESTVDDPKSAYRQGLLARDGGHFRALFATEFDAQTFATNARNLLMSDVPGLLFDISIEAWQNTADKKFAWVPLASEADNSGEIDCQGICHRRRPME
jgi:hypothetical protein